MGRKRTSIIWSHIDDDGFRDLVATCVTYKEILGFFGLVNKGSNHKTLKRRIKELNIDCSHLKKGYELMVEFNIGRKRPLEEILVRDSSYAGSCLKRRLLKEGLIENICSECGQGSDWKGKPLVMVLDHINGINNDHRVENLRMLCPNCNSQQDTFAGRNNAVLNLSRICECGNKKMKDAGHCRSCEQITRRRVKRPSKEKLKEEMGNSSLSALGRKYGVSDNAVRKWAKAYSLI